MTNCKFYANLHNGHIVLSWYGSHIPTEYKQNISWSRSWIDNYPAYRWIVYIFFVPSVPELIDIVYLKKIVLFGMKIEDTIHDLSAYIGKHISGWTFGFWN